MIDRHRSIYINSNVFIYFVEGEDALFHETQRCFAYLKRARRYL